MKKFNFSKKHKNDNSENNKKKIFNKVKKIEIKPQFLVIGLVAIITVISLIYFIFLKYSPVMNFKYEGYGISGKEITENLLGASGSSENLQGSNLGEEKNVSLAKIEEQGTIFKKLNSYFIGNKEKTEIDLNYPIYINDKNTIYNLNQDITLISKNFEQVAGYPNISITDGKVYNGNSLERADSKEYIFAKTTEGIYINLKEIKISTTANEYVLPVNSLIVFEEDIIRYYSVQSNILMFNEIKDVDYNSQIIIKNIEEALDQNSQKVDKEYNYEELLTRLGIIESAKNDVEKEEIIEEDTSDDKREDKAEKDENKPNAPQDQQQLEEQTNAEYIKPEVTVEDFKAEVYTVKSNLNIKDPKARIIEAPTFEIYKDGKIYLRRVFKNSGEIQITGLVPETEYEIIGKYIYLNAENKKVENTFYKGTIKTKGYEALGTIELSKEEGEIYSNKIQIKNVKIISDLQNEAIKGINQIELETGNIKTVLKNNKVNELLEGKEVTIESSEGLKSNTKIEYAIKFYDKNGKELKVKNNKGKTRTSKKEPKVNVKIKEQDIVSVTLGLKLTNKDSVKLENYKYIITRPNGEKLKEERLSEHEKEIKLEDLDQNQYYKIKVYADYDLSDNKGIQKDVEIGNLVFATKPISTLGSLEMIVENKELTSQNAKISYKIDEDKTDKRLIQILNELTIKIVENNDDNKEISKPSAEEQNSEKESQHTNRNTTKEGTVIYTNTLTKEEIERLQLGEAKEINYKNLKSNTKYTIEITGKVELGNTKEEVPVTYTYKEFTTLKIPAKVEIKNQFVTGNLIDLDVRVEDANNSVLNEKVRMELRDEKSNLIDLQEIGTNKDWLRKTYEKLEENKTYKLSVYADQYNEGSTDETYKVNYLIKEIYIVTEPGISGNVGLTELTKKATGKNLVDMSSNIKWYVYPNFNTWEHYGKEYNEETKILKLGGYSEIRRAVYDLREYAGREVTMSFKAKNLGGTNAYIQNSKKDTNRTLIQGLTEEWKDYQYTLKVDSTGYLGFFIYGGNGIEVKELQIELGNRKTNYEEFKYTLQSNYSIKLEDKRDEITTNDYYIKIYEDNNLVKKDRYEEIPEENVITNAIKMYEVQARRQYKVELTIKIKEREYVLSSLEYNTKETEEIKGIYTKEDFLEIQSRGNYIVLNNIDLSGAKNIQYRFGNSNLPFEGKINFNGYTLTRDFLNTTSAIFYNIGEKGIIENINLNILLNNKIEKSEMTGLFCYNRGTIRNLKLEVTASTMKENFQFLLLGTYNYGTIENFIIDFQEPVYGFRIISTIWYNYGIIKNGYLIGENIRAISGNPSNNPRNLSALTICNDRNGKISNIYSLINIESDNKVVGSAKLVCTNAGKSSLENIYTVGDNNFTKDIVPNVYTIASTNIKNNYYFANEIFTDIYHKTTTKLALWDANFQNKLLNNDRAFNVDELVNKGYYPQINMPACMPKQEYIKLPEVEDKDLPDILSTELVEQGTNRVKVKIIVNNPSAEQINEISIENINTKILEQNYENGKSEVIVELYDPIIYVSNYNVESITTKGDFNQEYTRNFKKGERIIEVDLYKEIYTIQDWIDINKSPTENYILMEDLNFNNTGNEIKIYNRYTGKLNGNNHTISNIILTNEYLIGNLNGSFSNLYIQNLKIQIEQGSRIGLIYNSKESVIDNIHIKDVTLKSCSNSNINVGSLLAWADGNVIVRNCSATNVNIVVTPNDTISYAYIGGMVGFFNGNCIENSFVNNVNISINNYTYEQYIGGLLGSLAIGNVRNCYATGEIKGCNNGIGGVIGGNVNTIGNMIQNCYSYVNIETTGEYIGGILGTDNDLEKTNTTNNLSLGNIYTSKESNLVSRAVGNSKEEKDNYAFEKQRVNGYVTSKEEGAELLNYQELCNKSSYIDKIKLGDAYNYSKVDKGILPQLYNSKGTELLPNQENILISNEEIIEIDEILVEKTNNNTASIAIRLNNPRRLSITNVEIEDMEFNIVENINRENKTYIQLKAFPKRFYDTYKVSKIVYLEDDEEKTIDVQARIGIQFYKEIYNFSDWQSIEINTYQNYKLMSDIDFKGKNNIKSNVTMARLESTGKSLKNINLSVDNSYSGLIKEVKIEIEGVNFEDIEINGKEGNNYIGIIPSTYASIKNVKFKNIIINAKSNYVGCIGSILKASILDVEMENVNINANSYVGGLVGQAINGTINNLLVKEVNVNGVDYIGGVAGIQKKTVDSDGYSRIQIEYSNIIGRNYVGGIVGRAEEKITDSISKHNIVKGESYVGGQTGDKSVVPTKNSKNNRVENCEIYGKNKYIGGLSGQSNAYERYAIVRDSKIIGEDINTIEVGGIFGRQAYRIWSCMVDNCRIISAGDRVGGISGWNGVNSLHGASNCLVINSRIEGNSKIGGIYGEIRDGTIEHSTVNAEIIANEGVAGGIIGYMENKNMTAANVYIKMFNNNVANSMIVGPTKIGGLVGDIERELYINERIKFYYNNYVHAKLESYDEEKVSMGIGGYKIDNVKLENTYIYKYSTINEKYANESIDIFDKSQYLTSAELQLESTYRNKIGWGTNYIYTSLKDNYYPFVKNIEEQEGISLPKDENYNVSKDCIDEDNFSVSKEEQNFEYEDKIIKTYSKYSEIISPDGNRAIRNNVRLYVKNGKLYALPVKLNLNNSIIKLVESNFIIDSYNGKEYETILGEDGKLYDLKEPLKYPENFENKDITSIGNNLSKSSGGNGDNISKEEYLGEMSEDNKHEIEVTYKNGDKVKFNYQTGEVISSSSEDKKIEEEKIGLLEYLKEKVSEIGDSNTGEIREITGKYEESKLLKNKLEEMPVEEALQRKNSNEDKPENITNAENDKDNNSLKETRYISIYNAEKDDYQIYQEKELLDTSKQEVVSENEKIEANNLKEYYASEGESKNMKMGIVWITLSIVGVIIILFAIKKRD